MDTNALTVYYIRHADADNGAIDKRDICDRDITPLGEKQLALLSKRFGDSHMDAVLTSPLVRTVKTAAAVANGMGGDVPVEIIPELIEKGATPGYFGQPLDVLKQYYGNLFVCKDKIHTLPDVGDATESKEQCLARAGAVVAYLRKRFTYGQKIVVVGHGTFAINFHQAAMEITHDWGFRMTTENTAVTKLQFSSDGVNRIVFHNDVSHLLALSATYQRRL